MSELLQTALDYVRRGWAVLPLHTIRAGVCTCGNPQCTSPGKHPIGSLVPHGLKNATTDQQVVRDWWEKRPDANIGVRTGEQSGIIVLDVDVRSGGDRTLDLLQTRHGALPKTSKVITGSGGWHCYFRHPGCRVKNSCGSFGDGVDLKGDDGYVVAPPSLHVAGEKYRWSPGHGLDDMPPADPPAWLLDGQITKEHPNSGNSTPQNDPKKEVLLPLPSLTDPKRLIPEGQRNSTLTRMAGGMRYHGFTKEAIAASLLVTNRQCCSPPLPEPEVRRIAESIGKYPPGPARAYVPFPVEILPQRIRDFVSAGAKALNCDPSFIAVPLLAALGAAIGSSRRICLKGTWNEPPVIWAAIVAPSGTLKSPAMDFALRPLKEAEDKVIEKYKEDLQQYERDKQRYEEEKRRKGSNTWRDDKGPPEPPVQTRYTCQDITMEAVAPLLEDNPGGLLVIRDELLGWFGSFDQYKPRGRGADAPNWLQLHRAGRLLVDRKGKKGPIYVNNAAVSIIGGIQTDVLRPALGQEHMVDGLAARLLFCMPPDREVTWSDAEVNEKIEAKLQSVFEGLLALDFEEDQEGRPRPVFLPLTREAKQAWVEFYNDWRRLMQQLTGPLRAAHAKLEAYAARFALIFHIVRFVSADPSLQSVDAVDKDSIDAGIKLARWFAQEAVSIYSILGTIKTSNDDKDLIDLIQSKGGRITVRELMQSRRKYRKSKKDAQKALDDLASKGGGRWTNVPPKKTGGRSLRYFELCMNEPGNGGNGNTTSDNTRESGVPSPLAGEEAEERAAIAQYDGGLPREDAERLAYEDVEEEPF